MSDVLSTIEYKGYTIKIHSDEHAENPRKEYDHACTMVCWHRRYNLGDLQPKENPLEYMNKLAAELSNRWLEDELEMLEDERELHGLPEEQYEIAKQRLYDRTFEENHFHKPLFLYDHSGITISLGAFGCPWDSGQVGFIYISKKRARKEWLSAKTPEELEAKVSERMAAEVEEYDTYLVGGACGYTIWKDELAVDDCSCWGFYSEKHCVEEAKAAIDHMVAKVEPPKLQISYDEVEYMLKHVEWLCANYEKATGKPLTAEVKQTIRDVLEEAMNA